MDKISVIIPTYDRFKYLLNCIKSIKEQTYKNIEIIVVNDCSTQHEYYNWKDNEIIIIHLPINSKNKFGYVSCGYVRNIGIEVATGKYIAFCDDDDIWFPNKLKLQIDMMKQFDCKMSSTDGLIGKGIYNKNIKYKKYNAEHFYNTLQQIYKRQNSNLLDNGFPTIWDSNFLKIHNCVICSSVIIEKKLLNKINNFKNVICSKEDHDCWLRVTQYTNIAYVQEICFYYDDNHGDKSRY
jgi:glycosyltransferase involved in cell wall biosynthesis